MKTRKTTCLYTAVASELLDLRVEMVRIAVWHDQRPSEQALNSTTPFCVDTLELTEWIQFVFIERINQIIETRDPLPNSCDIAPMAEEYFKQRDVNARALIKSIKRVDDLLSGRVEAVQRTAKLSS